MRILALTATPISGQELRDALDQAGISASGDTGESDPLDAIEDAMQTFKADRIVLFTRSDDDARYREDVDPDEVRARFGVPVDHATPSRSRS